MRGQVDGSEAESIAISALGFIAADERLLPRFLSLSGIDVAELRAAAAEPGFLAGVLEFLLAHEPTLLAFAEADGKDPARIAAAHLRLAGGADR